MPLEVGGALRLRLEAQFSRQQADCSRQQEYRRQRSEVRSQRSEDRGQKTEIFLWERLLAAILQFERF
jgi:hypothetical protein